MIDCQWLKDGSIFLPFIMQADIIWVGYKNIQGWGGKVMRKIISMLLVLVMCCGILTGCSNVNMIKLPQNPDLTLESTKNEIEKCETLRCK